MLLTFFLNAFIFPTKVAQLLTSINLFDLIYYLTHKTERKKKYIYKTRIKIRVENIFEDQTYNFLRDRKQNLTC